MIYNDVPVNNEINNIILHKLHKYSLGKIYNVQVHNNYLGQNN